MLTGQLGDVFCVSACVLWEGMPESERWDENNLTSREINDLTLAGQLILLAGLCKFTRCFYKHGLSEFLIACFSGIAGLESSCGCSLAFTLQVPLFLLSKSHDLNVTGAVWVLV